jgi:hypothetical protein
MFEPAVGERKWAAVGTVAAFQAVYTGSIPVTRSKTRDLI